MSYDDDSFRAGLALGRALWRPPRRLPGVVMEFCFNGDYTVTWDGPRKFTIEWVDSVGGYGDDEGIVLQRGISPVRLTGGGGQRWQYGVCTGAYPLRQVIGWGRGRISYSNSGGDFTATVGAGGSSCVFCGTVFAYTSGHRRTLTVEF